MYHFGYSVGKDEDKYRQMIEGAYEKVMERRVLSNPFQEIALRLESVRWSSVGREEKQNCS